MQKNGDFFAFLLTFSTRSRIYFRRVTISRYDVKSAILGVSWFAMASFFGAGAYSVGQNANTASFAGIAGIGLAGTSKNETTAALRSSEATHPPLIDYTRPTSPNEFAPNAGGPSLPDLSSDEPDHETRLRLIETTSNLANLPSIWAHAGKINNEFGFRRNPFGGRTYEFHAGMDIDGERGDQVVAPAAGTVTKAGWQGGYGNMIEIDHGNGLKTRYGHLSKIEVAVGDEVTRDQLIGFIGSTGRSTGPHLHYELRLDDRPINPRRFLPPEPSDLN